MLEGEGQVRVSGYTKLTRNVPDVPYLIACRSRPVLKDPESWSNRVCEFDMTGFTFPMKSRAKKPTGADMAHFLLHGAEFWDDNWLTMHFAG